jgi:hypothetical protein
MVGAPKLLGETKTILGNQAWPALSRTQATSVQILLAFTESVGRYLVIFLAPRDQQNDRQSGRPQDYVAGVRFDRLIPADVVVAVACNISSHLQGESRNARATMLLL